PPTYRVPRWGTRGLAWGPWIAPILPEAHQKPGGPRLVQPLVERDRRSHVGNRAAPALLGCLLGNASPSEQTVGRFLRVRAHDGALQEKRNHEHDPELGRHANHGLELRALREALREREGKR